MMIERAEFRPGRDKSDHRDQVTFSASAQPKVRPQIQNSTILADRRSLTYIYTPASVARGHCLRGVVADCTHKKDESHAGQARNIIHDPRHRPSLE